MHTNTERTTQNTAYGVITQVNNSATSHTESRNSEQPSNTVDTSNAGGMFAIANTFIWPIPKAHKKAPPNKDGSSF